MNNPIDLAIIVLYVAGCTLLGTWLGSKSQGLKGYFLGEKHVPMWAIMLSIVATETSAVTFLSVPGLTYKDGGSFVFLQLALGYIVGRILVSVILLPGYFRGEMYSAYQVLGDRFGETTKAAASTIFLAMRTIGDGLRLVLTAKVIQEFAGLNMTVAIILMGTTAIVYTYLGGMRAVIWTDVIQFIVYIIGAIAALLLLVKAIPGGWSTLFADPGKFRLFDLSPQPDKSYTLWSGLFGGLVLSLATHGVDQLMVQRYLSARSRGQASAALITSGFVVFVQFALFLLIGVALAIYHGGGGPADPDRAFASFLKSDTVPQGIRGLIIAALFAASLSSSLSASASSTVSDILGPWIKGISEENAVRLAKYLTAFWGIAQIALALATQSVEAQAIESVLSVAALGAGLLLGLFLLGMAVPNAGQKVALAALFAGTAIVVSIWAIKPAVFAFPWYALIGSGTVLYVGTLLSLISPRSEKS